MTLPSIRGYHSDVERAVEDGQHPPTLLGRSCVGRNPPLGLAVGGVLVGAGPPLTDTPCARRPEASIALVGRREWLTSGRMSGTYRAWRRAPAVNAVMPLARVRAPITVPVRNLHGGQQ